MELCKTALSELSKAHGFEKHPFSAWRAEDEERDLVEWFIQPPFYEDILGNLGTVRQMMKPTTHLIFGTPGCGKTALRKMIEAALLGNSPSSLLIRYTDFSRVLVPGEPRPSLGKHVDELLRLGTISLLAVWYQSKERYEKLSIGERAELMGLVYEYYEGLPPASKTAYTSSLSPYAGRILAAAKAAGHSVVDGFNAIISVMKKEKFEPTKWGSESATSDKADPMIRLQRFWSLARAMGTENIWVLVDGIDEHAAVRTGAAIFQCIAEIVLNQRLLEFRDDDKQVMCFKVFLTRPEELGPLLRAENFRRDRIPIRKIEWRRKDLDNALQRRLAHYSNRRVLRFDDLCDSKLTGIHDRLLDECGLNPRILFFIAYQILAAFQSSDPSATKLDKDSIEQGIALGRDAKM